MASVPPRAVILLVPVLLGWSAPSAQEPPAPELLWSDVRSKDGMDLVFLPDGFPVDERDAYEASVRAAIRSLERQTASFVRTDRNRWNLHVGFVPSAEACPSAPGTPGDTAFRTYLSLPENGGLFESDEERLRAAARALSPGVDSTILVVRSDASIPLATGNLPGEGSLVRLPLGMESVLLHELGHSLFALGDEYVGGCTDASGHAGRFAEHERAVVAFYPNVTLDPSGERFARLTGKRAESIHLEEGSLYHRVGVFRARGPCVMQDSSAGRFCPPCEAVIAGGMPDEPPAKAPAVEVRPPRADGETRVELEHRAPPASVIRALVVLVSATADWTDERSAQCLREAEARLSAKTRYVESPWIGDGSRQGERVFSLEGHVTELSLGTLAPGDYVLLAATGNLRGLSPVATARFRVPE